MAALNEPHGSITQAGLAEVRRLCAELARSEEHELMRSGSLRDDPFGSLARAAEAAVAIAIEAGASLEIPAGAIGAVDVVAVIELVKNSYDAFASNAWIRFLAEGTAA